MINFQVQKYTEFKRTEIEWINEIPSHWALVRLKQISMIQNSNVDKKLYEDQKKIRLCNYTDVYKNEFINSNIEFTEATASDVEINRFGVKVDDVYITKDSESSDDIAVPAYVTETIKDVVCGYHLSQIRTNKKKMAGEYLFRLFQSKDYGFRYVILSKGITRVGLSINAISDSLTPCPPLNEQIAIVEYLRVKTSQIDKRIDLLVQKSEKYKNLKQSLVNETVTRGLLKNAKYGNSNVNWVGEIPENWTIQRIGTAFEERSEKVNDTDYPPLSVTMKGIVPQLENVAKTDNNENRKKVCINDFVINSRSDRRGSSGVSEYEGSVSVINIVLKPRKNFCGKYLHHLFRSYRFIEEYYRVGRGIVADLWTTRYSVMKAIEFPVPSVEEQQEIARYLDVKTTQIDNIIDSINKQIEILKELRKTLINDVVTGKIRVTEDGDLS